MKLIMKPFGKGVLFAGLALAGLLSAGCQSGRDPLLDDPAFAEVPGIAGAPANGNAVSASAGSPAPAATPVAHPPPTGAPAAGNSHSLPLPGQPLQGGEMIQVGDPLVIYFMDTPDNRPPFEETVKEDGTISLPYSQAFVAAGKTRGALEKEIRERYVPNYLRNLTPIIKLPERWYYVGGEVKQPSKQRYTGPTTVLKAIQSVGDFTDYAQIKEVKLTRADGKIYQINCKKARTNPELDLPVYAGDKIHVPRRLW